MSRIGTYASQQQLNNYLFKVQDRLNKTMIQVTTEKRAQDYKGIGYDTQRLIGYEIDISTFTRYQKNNDIEDVILKSTEPALTAIESTMSDFRKSMTSFNSDNVVDEDSIRVIQQQAFLAMQGMQSFLNTEVNGRYLFGGNRMDSAPVDLQLSSLEDFQARYDGNTVNYPTSREMHNESFDLSADSAYQVNWLTFKQDADGVTTSAGTSTITASTAQFSNVSVGSTIDITGTASNNGTYEVSAISNGGKTLSIRTVMLTDEAATAAPSLTPTASINSAIAQIDTVTLGGTVGEVGDKYSVIINGTEVSYTTDGTEATLDAIRDKLVLAINANSQVNANITAAADTAGKLTITARTAGRSQNVSASAVNNPASATNDNTAINITTTANAASTFSTNPLTSANFTDLTFNRSAGTITAGKIGSLNGLTVGSTFTISGSAQNNGTYTVETAGPTTITIKQKKLTDEGGSSVLNLGPTTLGYTVNPGDDTISGVATQFSGVSIGDKITVTGATTAGNNGTFTVTAVAVDGSSVDIAEALALTEVGTGDEMAQVTTSAPLTLRFGPGNMTFTNNATANDTITAAAGTFSNLTAGMTITTGGTVSNNSTYTIASVSTDGSSIDVLETLVTETATGDEIAQVALADGSIKSVSYYQGDTFSRTHRVSKNREFNIDLNAQDPAFERAIRAMGMIAQGKFGTAGGLDQLDNQHRIKDAIDLIDLSLKANSSTNAQYEAGFTSSMEQVFIDLGYQRSLIKDTNDNHLRLTGFYQERVAGLENADSLTAITQLLDDQRALEASYQAMATIRQLSLQNFI
ncbi:MAG: hypothetical protein COB46_00295 [Rhodospirillaceae bacterium]|nr:MAG: hypothetical protein COB46_00295 [Rhodospirillaceae bacterium]